LGVKLFSICNKTTYFEVFDKKLLKTRLSSALGG